MSSSGKWIGGDLALDKDSPAPLQEKKKKKTTEKKKKKKDKTASSAKDPLRTVFSTHDTGTSVVHTSSTPTGELKAELLQKKKEKEKKVSKYPVAKLEETADLTRHVDNYRKEFTKLFGGKYDEKACASFIEPFFMRWRWFFLMSVGPMRIDCTDYVAMRSLFVTTYQWVTNVQRWATCAKTAKAK